MLLYLVVWIIFVSVMGAIIAIPLWFDRVAVIALRWSGLGPVLYPTAVGIAVLIVTHPEQWTNEGLQLTRLKHADIGTVWVVSGSTLHVETAMGQWEPGFIERRIIREAVDWRLGRYIRDRLEVAVRKNALGISTGADHS
jgi:hypothetical protein